MKIKTYTKIFIYMMILFLIFSSITILRVSATTSNIVITGDFVDGGTNKTVSYKVTYNDNLFTKASTTNNTYLAKLSMVASATAYNPDTTVTFLKKAGFTNIKTKKANPTKTSNDTVSYIYGYKVINSKPLVAVIIKGTSGNYEWVSNFNIGQATTHAGFSLAEQELNSTISSYISNNGLSNAKYWVTGHSRGAAVANLYAKRLTDKYGKANIYAYTFATPRVSTIGKKTGYENIFNYINSGDFVTEVAPKAWGYKRFGTDITITASDLSDAKSTFKTLTGVDYKGYSKTETTNGVAGFVLFGGNSPKEYYTAKEYKKIIKFSLSAADVCQKGIGYYLAGDKTGYVTIAKIVAVNEQAKQFYDYFCADKNRLTDGIGHAHCQAFYYGWISNVNSKDAEQTAKENSIKKAENLTISNFIVKSTSKGKLTMSWTKVPSTKKYLIKVSISKNFTSKTTTNYLPVNNIYTISKLTSGKTYYIKIRTVSKIDDQAVYGKWSSVKTIKVK